MWATVTSHGFCSFERVFVDLCCPKKNRSCIKSLCITWSVCTVCGDLQFILDTHQLNLQMIISNPNTVVECVNNSCSTQVTDSCIIIACCLWTGRGRIHCDYCYPFQCSAFQGDRSAILFCLSVCLSEEKMAPISEPVGYVSWSRTAAQ